MTVLYLLDTCVVSQYLSPQARVRYPALLRRVAALRDEQGFALSAVTLFELHRGLLELARRHQGKRKAARIGMFLQEATILGLDHEAFLGWAIAAEIHQKCRAQTPAVVLQEGDLLILATALAHDRVLLTSDARLGAAAAQLGMIEAIEVCALE